MKLIEKTLWIEYADFLAAGWKEDTVKKANLRNGPYWIMMADPADRRKPLVQYDTLRDEHKKALANQFGDVYSYVAKEPIRKMVRKDFKAEEFYLRYRFDNDRRLPLEHQKKYCAAASWLNMMIEVDADKRILKNDLKLKKADFWLHVCSIIKIDNIDLPSSYQRLINRIDEYKQNGYACLIDWRFGNKLAAKIGKSESGYDESVADKQVALIRKAASLHNNFDAAQITRFVNPIFEKHNLPSISSGTVKKVIARNQHIITPGQRGTRIYNSNIAMQVSRKRPDFPLYYWCLDGWTVELLFQQEINGRMTYNNRLVMVVVIDVMNNYPVGYAIGERENAELIKQANRNAVLHMQELFGEAYRPWQLQSDNFAKKQMTSFYEAMTEIYSPAAVGNAKSKVVEPYFNQINSKYFQTQPNWSGHNLNASKKNQPNTEMLDKIKTTFPNKAGVIQQINMMMEQERKTKIAEFVEKWSAMPQEDKVALAKEDMLMVFGKPHTHLNSITGQGIVATLGGTQYTYDSFDPAFRANQHQKWQLIYDECDMSQVLAVSEDSKLRFVLDQKRVLPMDIKSMTQDDHDYLTKIRHFNKTRREEIVQTYIEDAQVVGELMNDTTLNLSDFNEAAIKLMFTSNGQQKEGLQDAKGLRQIKQKQQKQEEKKKQESESNWHDQQLQYLQGKTDYNQYLD